MSNLVVKDYSLFLNTPAGKICPVKSVSFSLNQDEVVAIMGESGCGKSMTGLSLLGLTPLGISSTQGDIQINGVSTHHYTQKDWESIRGKTISMIYQDPLNALNPSLTIGFQMDEVLKVHSNLSRTARKSKVLGILEEVGIDDPKSRIKAYPHQLSGGMLQRIVIGMAVLAEPDFIIADEPTTALDVSIQKVILDLLRREQEKKKMGILLISHDLGVVSYLSTRLIIMYSGEIVEKGYTQDILEKPFHPYTTDLYNAIPKINGTMTRFQSIEGSVLSLTTESPGCRYAPRCKKALPICHTTPPPWITKDYREVRCHLYDE